MRNSLLALSLLFVLTACSGEPSESNMAEAVGNNIKNEIAQAKQMAAAFMGQKAADEMTKDAQFNGFESFEKLGCKEVGTSPGYNCDFKFSVTVQGQKREEQASGRFVNADNGWTVELARR